MSSFHIRRPSIFCWHLYWPVPVTVSRLLGAKHNTLWFSIHLHHHHLAGQSQCPVSPRTMKDDCDCRRPPVCLSIQMMCYISGRPLILMSTHQYVSPLFDCALLWLSFWVGQTQLCRARLLPSVFVKMTGCIYKGLGWEGLALWEGLRPLLKEALIITNAHQQTALYAGYKFTGNQEEQT